MLHFIETAALQEVFQSLPTKIYSHTQSHFKGRKTHEKDVHKAIYMLAKSIHTDID